MHPTYVSQDLKTFSPRLSRAENSRRFGFLRRAGLRQACVSPRIVNHRVCCADQFPDSRKGGPLVCEAVFRCRSRFRTAGAPWVATVELRGIFCPTISLRDGWFLDEFSVPTFRKRRHQYCRLARTTAVDFKSIWACAMNILECNGAPSQPIGASP